MGVKCNLPSLMDSTSWLPRTRPRTYSTSLNIFIIIFTLLPSLDSMSPQMLQKCCILGQQWSKKQDDCSTYPIPVLGVSTSEQEACLSSIEVCCIHRIQENMCHAGINVARRQAGACAIPRGAGSEHYVECCLCCKMGLQAAMLGEPCVSPDFGDPCDIIFENCCRNKPSNYTDEDECALYPGQLCEHICINTIGSYTCACEPGYVLAPNARSCTMDTSEVQGDEGGVGDDVACDQERSTDVGGTGVTCSCREGYRLLSDQRTCRDIDECNEGLSGCDHVSETCVNLDGSYQCVARSRCPTGYTFDQDTYTCVDLDECSSRRSVCDIRGERCENTQGSYKCVSLSSSSSSSSSSSFTDCEQGFKWSDAYQTCTDVDECLTNQHDCVAGRTVCLNTVGHYQCVSLTQASCPTGYIFSDASASCVDRNECEEGASGCDVDEECVNTIGGHHCNKRDKVSCPAGHQYNYVLRTCVDVDECSDGSGECGGETVCVNTVGSYTCELRYHPPLKSGEATCEQGFSYNTQLQRCDDVDECEAGVDDCLSAYMLCQNTLGGYRCRCENGFYLQHNTNECEDENECVTGKALCLVGQRCANTIGSYACERETNCGTGYTLNGLTQQCEDDDECTLATHDCGAAYQCKNTYGSYRCALKRCSLGFSMDYSTGQCTPLNCAQGMEPAPNGNCVDMDECIALAPCRANQYCLNTVGTYTCVDKLNCGGGYQMDDTGSRCIDMDECSGEHECRGGQVCVNRPGGYVCQCTPGFTYNAVRRVCVDINECEHFGEGICSTNADCENLEGSYKCNCHQGFILAPDGKNCRDVNECDIRSDLCEQGCLNTWGSYQCTCQQGFKLSDDKRMCTDIDECSVWSGQGSLCIGQCRNTVGSYECHCPDGYTMSADGRTCQDEDECLSEPCSGEDQLCLNTRGGYRCNTVRCPEGYVKDPDHDNRCKRKSYVCKQDDQACLTQPLSYSYNHLSFLANMSIRPGGIDFFTMRGALWSTTDVQFELTLIDVRAPSAVTAATRSDFRLREVSRNQAIISVMKSLMGPQEIDLQLKMTITDKGQFAGIAISNIYILVSQYDF